MSTEKTAQLLSLVSACLPNHEQLKHDYLLENIAVMEEYQELVSQSSIREVYERYFTMEILEGMKSDQLINAQRVIPKAVSCLRSVAASVQNGAGPLITEEDLPNFYNENEIDRLLEKLDSGTGENYTNIPPENFMILFSKDTVKSGKDLFKKFDADEKDFGKAIESLMKNQPYCISEKEMNLLEEQYQTQINKADDKNGLCRQGLALRLTKKLVCCVFACMIPALAAAMTGMLNPSMMNISETLIAVASIIFIIGG